METPDGFLRTGDVGYLDARKRLYVVGRKKEVIVTGEGFNVYAEDIEAVIYSLNDLLMREWHAHGTESADHGHIHADHSCRLRQSITLHEQASAVTPEAFVGFR